MIHRLMANLPFVPQAAYLRLHRDYMTSEAERAASQRRAAELLTENVRLRRQLDAANYHHGQFRALLEDMAKHTEEVANAG